MIVTYYWPPSGGSGVQRWLKFAKYLPEFGWDPVVVAPEDADYTLRDDSLAAEVPPGVEVLRLPIREPYSLFRTLTGTSRTTQRQTTSSASPKATSPGIFRRLGTWIRANFFVPDPKVLWVDPTVRTLARYLAEDPVDAIVTTGPPHSLHLIGRALRAKLPDVRWLMDVRDPWSQFDVHLAFGPGRRAVAKNKRLEAACLAAADLVIGTSYSMPDSLEAFDRHKYRTVTNGYDATDFVGVDRTGVSGSGSADGRPGARFRLYHTGLLGADRNPNALWRALASLCGRSAAFREALHVHLVGEVAREVGNDLAAHPELAGRYTITPWLDHATLLGRYAEADCFLLCPNRSDNARSQINGKLFEYLAMRRPILHVGPFDSDNTRILDRAHAGLTVPVGDAVGMEGAIRELWSGTFSRAPHAFAEETIRADERRALTLQLSQLLHRA